MFYLGCWVHTENCNNTIASPSTLHYEAKFCQSKDLSLSLPKTELKKNFFGHFLKKGVTTCLNDAFYLNFAVF